MPHIDVFHNGVKLVSATQLPALVAKPFLEVWRTKLCQCKTHELAKKTKFKPSEEEALAKFGKGHCGLVYADNVKDDAAVLGNEVHSIVEEWFKTGNLQRSLWSVEGYTWAEKIVALYKLHNVKPVIILPEENIVDEESNLAGSPDTIGEWDGRVEILDTKIKNQLDDLTAMQGCAYRYLLKRKFGVDIRYMRAIWCQKSTVGKLVKDVLFDLDDWMESWKGLVLVWNKLHSKRQVRIL